MFDDTLDSIMFSDISFYFIIIFLVFSYFIFANFEIRRVYNSKKSTLKNIWILRDQLNEHFVDYTYYLNIFMCIDVFFFNDSEEEECVFYNTLYSSNTSSFNIELITIILFILTSIVRFMPEIDSKFSNEYQLSMFILSVTIPLILLSNSLFTFFFFLELISWTMLWKFSVIKPVAGKFWENYKDNNGSKINPKNLANVMLYQYFSNFFSSILILFSVVSIFQKYGTTEWIAYNFINLINGKITSLNDFNGDLMLYLPLYFAIFFKMGVAPVQLFKVEIYKGIPFLTLCFYTTMYFFAYFSVTVVLIYDWFISNSSCIWFFLIIFLVVGILHVLTLIFDVVFIKAFFAYSTVINVIGFLILIISSIS